MKKMVISAMVNPEEITRAMTVARLCAGEAVREIIPLGKITKKSKIN